MSIDQVKGEGGYHRSHRYPDPTRCYDVGQDADVDRLQQSGAQMQHRPKRADERAGERHLSHLLPRDLEVGRGISDHAPIGIGRRYESMGNKEHADHWHIEVHPGEIIATIERDGCLAEEGVPTKPEAEGGGAAEPERQCLRA